MISAAQLPEVFGVSSPLGALRRVVAADHHV